VWRGILVRLHKKRKSKQSVHISRGLLIKATLKVGHRSYPFQLEAAIAFEKGEDVEMDEGIANDPGGTRLLLCDPRLVRECYATCHNGSALLHFLELPK
jgi:hypothetical protein